MGNTTLGGLIRSLREAADLSQEELAARAGVSRGSIQNWERDLRKPRRAEFRRLATALGTTVAELNAKLEPQAGAALTRAEAVTERRELEEQLAHLDDFAPPGTAAHTILSEALQDRITDLNKVIHDTHGNPARRPEADTAS